MPGTDISARASITLYEQTQSTAGASISYLDTSGNPGEESQTQHASVTLETTADAINSDVATVFVAPPAGAPVYFTNTRSFYAGASLEGKCVKLIGVLRLIGNVNYIDDGGVLLNVDEVTGRKIRTPTPVGLRCDLLTSLPAVGTRVLVEGVCRRETSGSLTLLPLANSAVAQVR